MGVIWEIRKTSDPVNPWVVLKNDQIVIRMPTEALALKNMELLRGKNSQID